jgi:tRNA nucleotidyltransferase (CCA-adding enzyme)
MQVYLVGGAVRDALLGLPVTERDWVVVGATPEELEAAGFRPVGRDFPVFLHPDTQEEHALARLERKTGAGYRGFTTEFSPKVTLEEDLRRRDLTVNAIAQAANGQLIDPYGGQADLRQRILRHVSPAFSEDPLRVLRVARFAARFAALGFAVAPETLALMRRMADTEELNTLSPERIWRETERALASVQPERFFAVLRACGALARVMPELDVLLQKAPQGATALTALRATAYAGGDGPARWASLVGELTKHDLDVLQARLRVPNAYSELASLHRRLATLMHAGHLSHERLLADAAQMLKLLEVADALRRPERFASWLHVYAARATAGGTPAQAAQTACERMERALKTVARVKLGKTELESLQGPKLAERLHELRLEALRELK